MSPDILSNVKDSERHRVLGLRRRMNAEEKKQADAAIFDRLTHIEAVTSAQTICTYVSLPEEVDTKHVIDWLWKNNKTVVIPRVDGDQLVCARVMSWDDLVPGAYKLMEPKKSCPIVVPASVSLWIIPGVAFDRAGNRLGWGKGYYDTLLTGVASPKIGLAYDFQVLEQVPHTSYDVSMNGIVTDKDLLAPKGVL